MVDTSTPPQTVVSPGQQESQIEPGTPSPQTPTVPNLPLLILMAESTPPQTQGLLGPHVSQIEVGAPSPQTPTVPNSPLWFMVIKSTSIMNNLLYLSSVQHFPNHSLHELGHLSLIGDHLYLVIIHTITLFQHQLQIV